MTQSRRYSICSKPECRAIIDPPATRAYCKPCWNAYWRNRNATVPGAAAARAEAARRKRAEDPSRNLAAVNRWRDKKRKEWNAYQLAWRATHLSQYKVSTNKSRAKRKKAPGSHTFTEWLRVLQTQNFRCLYCDASLTEKTASQDHATPLTRGGSDDISNIVAACLRCNHKKCAKTREEFLAVLGKRAQFH